MDTVEFVEADERMDLPPPLNLANLESMSLSQKKAALSFEPPEVAAAEEEDEEMEMEVGVFKSLPFNGFIQDRYLLHRWMKMWIWKKSRLLRNHRDLW